MLMQINIGKENMKIIFVLFFLLPLASCKTSEYHFKVIDLKLLETMESFTESNSTVSAIGMLRVTIQTNVDIVKYTKANDLSLRYSAKSCKSNRDIERWRYFYSIDNGATKPPFNYVVLLDYKSKNDSSEPYNFAKNPESICMQIGGVNMNPFINPQSDLVEIPISLDLFGKLQAYDTNNGLIYFECKASKCRPDSQPN